MNTVEMKLTRKDLKDLQRRRAVCGHCGGVFVPLETSFVVCEPCVEEALKDEGFPYRPTGEQTMDYKDHVSICTEEVVLLPTNERTLEGVMSMRVREFPDKYGFFMHVDICLVESFTGPLEEIGKAFDRVEKVKKDIGPKVTWKEDNDGPSGTG